jgi:hypothetical protein
MELEPLLTSAIPRAISDVVIDCCWTALAIEEIAAGDAATSTIIAVNNLVTGILNGYATPAQSVFQVVMLKPEKPIVFPNDIAAAKAAIAKAGGLSLTLGVPADEAPNVGMAVDLIVALLAEIGVDYELVLLERDEAQRRLPCASYPWDGVADVRPFARGGEKVVEGVY